MPVGRETRKVRASYSLIGSPQTMSQFPAEMEARTEGALVVIVIVGMEFLGGGEGFVFLFQGGKWVEQ